MWNRSEYYVILHNEDDEYNRLHSQKVEDSVILHDTYDDYNIMDNENQEY